MIHGSVHAQSSTLFIFMCSVLFAYNALADASLAVYFVRDESFDRLSEPPQIWAEPRGVIAPRDAQAGGTWFGIAAGGFLAGLVNRPEDETPDNARSRGQLMLDVLSSERADDAWEKAFAAVAASPHGGCRLFIGDGRELTWCEFPAGETGGERMSLEPGTWLVQHRQPPHAAPTEVLASPAQTADVWLERVHTAVAGHAPHGEGLCRHGDTRGSVDLTVAVLDRDGYPKRLGHRHGFPCGGRWSDMTSLLVGG